MGSETTYRFIRRLDELTIGDVAIAGGKNAPLSKKAGQMRNANPDIDHASVANQ